MFFSIIVTVYNAERYLEQCIQSILNQTESDYEIILVDDGSRDKSGKICDMYASKYPGKIQVFHTNNQGALLARRLGMINANGKYLWNIDSDDLLPETDALSILKFHILENDCDFVFFNSRSGDQLSSYNRYFNSAQLFVSREDKQRIYNLIIDTFSFNSLWNKVFLKSLVDFESDYSLHSQIINGNDFFQMLPIITAANNISYIDRTLYYYREIEGSTVRRFDPRIYNAIKINCLRLNSYIQFWEMDKEMDRVYVRHLKYIAAAINKVRLIPYREKLSLGLPYLCKIREDPFFLQTFKDANIEQLPFLKRIVVFLLFQKMYLLLLLIP